jgi:6-phosphogluconolactonase
MTAEDVTIDPIPELAARLATWIESASRASIAERGTFSMAIPGGSAAERLLPALVEAPIDWNRVSVFWVDERRVPLEHPDSNFRIAKEVWLDRSKVSPGRVHPMLGEASDYAKLLPARLDLVLLGVGADGHVASLFPGHRLLKAWDRDVAVLDDAPKPPARRMTLTLRAITRARRVLVFAAGAEKSAAIADALNNEDSELPLALAMLGDGPVSFLLDPAAAAGL